MENTKYPRINVELSFVIQQSPLDSLIQAVIPRAIDMIWNSCRPIISITLYILSVDRCRAINRKQ